MLNPSSSRHWSGLVALCTSAVLAHAGTYKNITVDGSFGDWAGVPVAYEDPADSTTSADYRRIWIANDENYLYLRFTLERAANPFLSTANLFVDTDANAETGYRVLIGSELLIQGGSGYDERAGGFNDGAVENLGWQSAPEGDAVEFELRVARTARYVTGGEAVFSNDTVTLLLEAEDPQYIRQETAPDSEGMPYTFAPVPPPLASPEVLASLTGTSWRVNDAGADLGTAWRETDFDDSGDGWRSGAGLFGYSANPGLYPAALATPLAAAASTVYLRTTFDWNYSPAGLAFAVSNWLSDGAVLYLNGAEVRRIRLPEGPVSVATPATGGPATPGAAEIFGLSGAPLVVGANTLAVELHQASATPTDLVFGLSLTATPQFPVRLVHGDEPADRTATAGDTVTLTAEILGTPPLTFEWRKDGTAVPGGTNQSLTFEPVLKTDEGSYTLHVANPGGEATTRPARLTVNVTPVTLTDPSLPQDLTVIEGATASFSVNVAGSPPISYQWLKDGFPITGATESTYTVAEVTAENAGRYSVQVSNPATPGTLSRAANLVVLVDHILPTIAAVTGTPDQITVTFSEPVDPVTAGVAANYALSGGLTISSVAVSSQNPAVVTLSTSKQTLLTDYTVTISKVADLFGNVIAAGSSRPFRSTIAVDGRFDDWADVPLAHSDPSEPPTAGTDFADLWVTNDAQYLYIRFTLHSPGNPGTFLNNIFLDTDTENTGFGTSGIGSELLVQQGAGYQQKNGAFNEGLIEGLDFAMAPVGSETNFELRISRSARYASDQLPVFVSETIRFFLETENNNFVTTDTSPDSGGLEYTLVAVPPSELGPLSITLIKGQIVLTWLGPGKLQTRETLTSGAWTDVPDASSGLSVVPGAAPQFYQLVP